MSPWASCAGLISALFVGQKTRPRADTSVTRLGFQEHAVPASSIRFCASAVDHARLVLCSQPLVSASHGVHSSHHSPLIVIAVLAVPAILCDMAQFCNGHDRCDMTHIESVSHHNRSAKSTRVGPSRSRGEDGSRPSSLLQQWLCPVAA